MRWSCVLTVAVVFLAAALTFTAGLAQQSPGSGEGELGAPERPRTLFQSLNQFSAVGASAGVMKLFGGDLGSDAQARPLMQGVFRYRFNDRWVGLGDFGFGWNSFKDQGDTVLTFTFGTLGVARSIGDRFGLEWRATAGAGYYRWNYKYHGKSLRDSRPVDTPDGTVDDGTQRFYRGTSPGGFLGLESEYRLTGHVTMLAMLQWHYVFTADKDLFNYVFDQNHSFLGFRVGMSYHFSPYEGILWERKEQTKIRLESGRGGL